MKKMFVLMVLSAFMIFSISAVSALTIITGTVYYDMAHEDEAAEATVYAECNGFTSNSTLSESITGQYTLTFPDNDCPDGEDVLVTATLGNLEGTDTGTVGYHDECECVADQDCTCGIDIAFACPVLIPEFGTVVGILTILSSIGIFLLVRRR